MSAFGAGDLNSYMGGGGDYETPSKASYGNNMQIIFVYIIAAGIAMLLLGSVLVDKTPNDDTITTNTEGPGNANPSGGSGSSESSGGSGSSESSGGTGNTKPSSGSGSGSSTTEEISAENIYESLLDIDIDKLLYDLSESKDWIAAGDTNLILKVLEKKTYDNSMIENFDVKLTFSENGGSKSLDVEIKPLNAGITRISKIDILYSDGKVDTRHIQDASAKKSKFTIPNVRDGIKKVIVYDTRGGSVTVSSSITVEKISYEDVFTGIETRVRIIVEAKSEVGISKIQFINNNGDTVSKYTYPYAKKSIKERDLTVGSINSVEKVRLTDASGFSVDVPIIK